jgi:hypothetical protein
MDAEHRPHRTIWEDDYFSRRAHRDGIFVAPLGEFIATLEEHGVLIYDAGNGVVKTPARAVAKAVQRWQEEIDQWAPNAAAPGGTDDVPPERAPGAAQ